MQACRAGELQFRAMPGLLMWAAVTSYAGIRRDSVRKMSAEADPNPAPRPAGGS